MAPPTHASLGLPETHRALVFHSASEPAVIETVPTPLPTAGSVVVKPLHSTVFSYIKDIFTGGNPRKYRYPLPFIGGSSAVARVAAAATDAPSLKPGQLVWVDHVVYARDGSSKILHGLNGLSGDESYSLMTGEWRDGVWQEYVRVPAENVHPLDEAALLGGTVDGGLGYRTSDLGFLANLLIAYGGLGDVGVRPGETVLVAPATGSFGGSAVHVALALGARVIALGRNKAVLADLARLAPANRITTLDMSGSSETDTANILAANRGKPVDVYFDMTPPTATSSPHIKGGIMALRPQGRMSMMGGAAGDVHLPYYQIMSRGLTLKGTYMYTPQQAKELIDMVERGVLRIGDQVDVRCVGSFPLEQWADAFALASNEGRMGRYVCISPNKE